MRLPRFLRRPTPAEAAAVLSRHRAQTERARIRAKARAMRAAMGLPEAEALR